MKKKSKSASAKTANDVESPTISREQMRGGTAGKYYKRVMERSNVVRINSELTAEFPNEAAVNRALRQLLQLRDAVAGLTVKTK